MCDCRQLIDLCRNRKVYIQTHNFPDPDAIASGFGLQKLLANFQISSVLCYEGKIDKLSSRKMTETFGIDLYSYDEIKADLTEEDYIICVDSQKNGGNIADFIGKEIACIDHHPEHGSESYLYRDIREAGSCATLIAQYYQRLKVEPDRKTASALLYGIKMDTLHFSRGVTELDIQMFEYLFPRADHFSLEKMEKNNMELSDLKAYGAAIENIVLYGTVGFAFMPFECPDALIAVVSDFILELEEVEVAILYAKRKDGIKFSVRSENRKVHAGKLTENALRKWGNGGGHAFMAGGMIRKEKEHLLGKYPDVLIREAFLDVLDGMDSC
ncbi:MAG: DHH family phosphoesterase [Lachnospiraceae bacterium]|nr:DHH family phosphoesterase [Lachnospiraceae bacterium]